jgi:hypothetical protein
MQYARIRQCIGSALKYVISIYREFRIMPKKGKKSKLRKKKAQAQSIPKPSVLYLLRQIIETAWGKFLVACCAFATLVTVLSGFAFFLDIFQKLAPEVHPHDSDSASPYILPFIVKNRSSIFDMKDVYLTCAADLVIYEDAVGHRVVSSGFMVGQDSYLEVIRGDDSPKNYPCDTTAVMHANPNGSLSMGNLMTSPNVVQSELKVVTMCVSIRVKYKTGFIPRTYMSPVFQWVKTPEGSQWLEGQVIGEKNSISGICNEVSEKGISFYIRLLENGQFVLER